MQWIKLFIFILAVTTTIDFIVDTIEVMSGRSEDHKVLNETKVDAKYQFVPVLLWTGFYVLSQIPW